MTRQQQLDELDLHVHDVLACGGADVQRRASQADPFYRMSGELVLFAERLQDQINGALPVDMDRNDDSTWRGIQNNFGEIMGALLDLSSDHREYHLAGCLNDFAAMRTPGSAPGVAPGAVADAPLEESPLTHDPSPDAADSKSPLQPREEPLQIAIPGVPQLLPAQMTEFGTDDWTGDRTLLTVLISPEQVRALGVRFVRYSQDEINELRTAGYDLTGLS